MEHRIILLGTGTCQLQEHRRASSALVELGDLRLVFDLGRGVADRLAEIGLRQDDVEHLVLSHFHPDHLSDLIPYLQAGSWSRIDPRSVDLNIYGPPGLEVQLMRILSLFEPGWLVRETFRVHLHEVHASSFEIGGHRFDFIDLPPAGNHGLRFVHRQRCYGLTGDSYFHDQEVAFVRDTDLAIVDAGHLDEEELLELAIQTQVPCLVASHLYGELDEIALNVEARRRGYEGRIVVGEDLMVLDLDPANLRSEKIMENLGEKWNVSSLSNV